MLLKNVIVEMRMKSMGSQCLWNYFIDREGLFSILEGEGGRQRTDGEGDQQEKSEAGL